ncbi:DUF1906 domain-containing protein [Alteribacter natronophilus]|nr:DUF1906 domain-containing protein [Alteribacter natronophilus]
MWGVNSARPVDQALYDCVQQNLGDPAFWGRFLTEVPDVSAGLTVEEIRFIRENGMRLLPIYNDFRVALGDRRGRTAARNAIFNAQRLGIPEGTFLFANLERFFDIDAAWLIAWVDAFLDSGYRPGFYNDPVQGDFNAAFCQAVEAEPAVLNQSVLWSAEPEPGTLPQAEAPAFAPAEPDCGGSVWAWQYGRDSDICPIDTVLMNDELFSAIE